MKENSGQEEAIQTLQQMIDAECLVVGHMEAEGETDIDRRPLRALVAGLNALKNSPRKDNTMRPDVELTNRIKQYKDLVYVAPDESEQIKVLVEEEEWTQEGAERLVSLAHEYGYWFLLHAAGLAIAAKIEDGRLNY